MGQLQEVPPPPCCTPAATTQRLGRGGGAQPPASAPPQQLLALLGLAWGLLLLNYGGLPSDRPREQDPQDHQAFSGLLGCDNDPHPLPALDINTLTRHGGFG